MDRRAHPLDRSARAAASQPLVLACAGCGFLERWPWPLGLAVTDVRCTCPRCGDQLHERERGAPGGDVAHRVSSRDADL